MKRPRHPSRPTLEQASRSAGLRLTRSLAGLALLAGLSACGAGPADRSEQAAAAVQSYNGTGEVLYLPGPSRPAITIRHEAIDDFVDMDGEVVGMQAMTMPFPLAAGVSLDGIEPGDPVRFTLEVEWDGEPPYRISELEKIPPAD